MPAPLDSPPKPLPWSLRERLLASVRADLARHGRASYLPRVLAPNLERIMKRSGDKQLGRLARRGVDGVPFARIMESWVSELPATHRAEWLVGRVSALAGVTWGDEPTRVDGPLRFPRAERDRIKRRLERLRRSNLRVMQDEPDDQQYADYLAFEMDRLGRKNDAFAVRVVTRRFPDRAGSPTLTFREALDNRKLSKVEDFVRFLERKLEIEWADVKPDAPPPPPRPYAPKETYAAGEVIAHPKFGLGTVTVVESGRVRVKFGDGERLLAAKT